MRAVLRGGWLSLALSSRVCRCVGRLRMQPAADRLSATGTCTHACFAPQRVLMAGALLLLCHAVAAATLAPCVLINLCPNKQNCGLPPSLQCLQRGRATACLWRREGRALAVDTTVTSKTPPPWLATWPACLPVGRHHPGAPCGKPGRQAGRRAAPATCLLCSAALLLIFCTSSLLHLCNAVHCRLRPGPSAAAAAAAADSRATVLSARGGCCVCSCVRGCAVARDFRAQLWLVTGWINMLNRGQEAAACLTECQNAAGSHAVQATLKRARAAAGSGSLP